MDFTKYGLEGEQLAQAQKDYDADVLGLKNKNTELIDREKVAKDSVEAMTLQISITEENNKVALAEKDGTVEQYKSAIAERDEKIKSINFEFQETNNKRLIETSVNDFSTALADDPAGRMYMQSQFSGLIEVKDGAVVSRDVTKTVDEVKQSLVSDEANARYIKAVVGSGGGAAGSESSGGSAGIGANKPFKDKSMAEKVAYLEQK